MKYWCFDSPVWTHFGNATSILFPAWEKAFAAVIEHHLPSVQDPELKSRMLQFIKEELSHAKAHETFNIRHNLKKEEQKQFVKTRVVHKKPSLPVWLGTMVSIEHMAACISRAMLDRFGSRSGRDYNLFIWHSKEELGHKSLAIDLWNYLGYSKSALKKASKANQAYVLKFLIGYTLRNVYQDRALTKLNTWKDLVIWAWFMVSKIIVPAKDVYSINFHPNNYDDSKWVAA